jgi:sugar phosphate isomerase/epimerase
VSAAATDALAVLPGYSDLGPDDLILSHFSLGRSRPFEERVRAAAEAGFAAMGLYIGEYQRLRAEGARDADLRSVLDHYGMPLVEIEALRGWSATGADRAAYLQTERSVFAMSDALGPGHHVQVIGPYTGTLDDAAEAFAGVCDRAAEHGLAAAIEFLPEMSNIPDAATAMQIVTRAGRANGGICLDCWHHFRGANDDDMLRAIPVERIFTVQFNDGPRQPVDPDYYTDCTRYRDVPGAGEFDLTGFLGLLAESGVRLPLSVEVISTDLLQRPAAEVARQLAGATRAVVTSARDARGGDGVRPPSWS